MSKKKKNNQTKEIIDRHLRIPAELDKWLVDYTKRGGFNSEVQAVLQMVRDTRTRDLRGELAAAWRMV